MKVFPKNVPTLLDPGRVEEERKRFDKAAGYLEAVRLPSSSHYLVHNGFGVALMKLERPSP